MGLPTVDSPIHCISVGRLAATHILLDNAALRATYKLNQLIALRCLCNLGLGLVTTRQVVKLALEQDAAGVVDRLNLLGSKATARKTHLVDTCIVRLAICCDDKGRNILRYERTTLNHCVVADMNPLVECCVATDNNPVANLNLSSQRYTICDNAVATNNIVVSNMHIGHKQVVVANNSCATRCCTSRDGYALANIVVVANNGSCLLTGKLQILWQTSDASTRVHLVALTQACTIIDAGVGSNPAIVANDYIALDIGKWLDSYVVTDLCIGMYVSQITNHKKSLFVCILIFSTLAVLGNLGGEHSLASERTTSKCLTLSGADTTAHIRNMTLKLQGIAGNNLLLPLYAIGLEEVGRI